MYSSWHFFSLSSSSLYFQTQQLRAEQTAWQTKPEGEEEEAEKERRHQMLKLKTGEKNTIHPLCATLNAPLKVWRKVEVVEAAEGVKEKGKQYWLTLGELIPEQWLMEWGRNLTKSKDQWQGRGGVRVEKRHKPEKFLWMNSCWVRDAGLTGRIYRIDSENKCHQKVTKTGWMSRTKKKLMWRKY